MAKNWIQDAIKNPGALRAKLHIPEGKKIPKAKIKTAERSKSPTLRKEASLADTLGKIRRKK